MADKEATIYVIDVGKSMKNIHNGRDVSDLDWAMTYVWDKITTTVATERKTATLGVIGLRTDGTANELGNDQDFKHISVWQEISQILLPDLKQLHQKIKPSSTANGDAISAIIIAIQMIVKYCKKLKYQRRIILMTDARGIVDPDQISEIIKKIVEEGIELIIVGVDFDDPDYGYKEEDKDFQKAANERLLKSMAEDCKGIFGTLQQAVEELGIPRMKLTRPVNSYKGQLTLGDPEKYSTACCIDVERFPRTMIRRPLTASRFVQRLDNAPDPSSVQSSATVLPDADDGKSQVPEAASNNLSAVRGSRIYQINDENAPGGKREVDRDELAKGYEYGRTAVHISESDENVTKLETKAGLDLIGFIPWSSYDRFMSMTVSSMIIAQKTNTKAIMALSSLIHALYELESYGVARLVPKADKSPVLILLAPSIESDYECLLDVQLPFAEDMHSYKFASLDKIVTMSGKTITQHRNLPTDALKFAVSDYVDKMDLSTFGKGDEGEPTEYMPMTDTYSPILHRIDQAVRWRAVHPDKPTPPPYEVLTRYSAPPEQLVSNAKPQLEKLISAANVKQVPPKAKSRKRAREEVKPLSGLNIDALLHNRSRPKSAPQTAPPLSPTHPIPQFRQLLDTITSPAGIHATATQFGTIIQDRIATSFNNLQYARAAEELGVLRAEMIELEEPGWYNSFLRGFKERLLTGELGGERMEMWEIVRKEGLGLVTKVEAESSSVGEVEAAKFLSSTSTIQPSLA